MPSAGDVYAIGACVYPVIGVSTSSSIPSRTQPFFKHSHGRDVVTNDDHPVGYQPPCPVCYLRRHVKWRLRFFVLAQRKPYSAVTVQIDRLTSEQYEENDLGGIVDLIEVIRIQDSGPTEAARAIRKKLKYGNVHRQLRALVILDALIQNAGSRFQKTFADEPLLERLRLLARDDTVDRDVRAKCNLLFRQWAVNYRNTPGLERICTLYKQLPQTRRPPPSKPVRSPNAETEEDGQPSSSSSPPVAVSHTRSVSSPMPSTLSPTTPTTSTSTSTSTSLFSKTKDKTKKHRKSASTTLPPFNPVLEKPHLLDLIASATVASTNLLNALQLLPHAPQQPRVSQNPECVALFETCARLRRQVLRDIQRVEAAEPWIGSLLTANDELVKAMRAFEVADGAVSDDEDSDSEVGVGDKEGDVPPPKPPRPQGRGEEEKGDVEELQEEEEDEENPFSDANAVKI